MINPTFSWAVPTFGGINDTHIDTPLIDRIDFQMLKRTAQLCELYSFNRLWVADHLILGSSGRILEAWTVMCYLSSLTNRVRIGSKVLCYAFRHPSILAKMAATLDVASNGRLDLGLGAGWFQEEAESYGIPFPKLSVRIEQLAEYIEILKKMFTEDSPVYSGKFYSIKNAICEPKPLQKPHPPIWLGTLRGGKKMTSLIAKYADGVNTLGTLPSVKNKIDAIRDACISIGRRFEELVISWDAHILLGKTEEDLREKIRTINRHNPRYPSYYFFSEDARRKHDMPDKLSWEEFAELNLIGIPDKIIKRIENFMEIGVHEFVLWFLTLPDQTDLELFHKEVMSCFV